MERVCLYLRKSRADLEAEARGEGETLAKHKKTLMRLAKEQGLNIVKIREEIVSGESLLHRPEMQSLLREVDEKLYDGVLVMDIDRLGRGNMQEQGLIQDTFRRTGTKIITPRKVYDLTDESDELMTEVESLFARQELKMITRRMQRGRVASVEEGNYIGTRPPYGYDIFKDGKNRYLVPNEEQAPIVKHIFERYCGELGANKIANELNEMGHKTYTGKKWTSSSVLTIIKNAVYMGRIQWKKKKQTKSKTPGKRRDTETRPVEEWIDAKGKHIPLVDEAVYNRAQEILKGKYHVPYQLENGITNPLAGIIRCGVCNSSMVMRPYTNQKPHLMCYNRFCENKSTRFEYVEEKLLEDLDMWIKEYALRFGKRKKKDNSHLVELREQSLAHLERELKELESQKAKLHDFLERGIYDESTYLERSQNLAVRIEDTKTNIFRSEIELERERSAIKAQNDVLPTLRKVVDLYRKAKTPAKQNELLKSVLQQALYRKEKWQRNDEFELELFPRVK